MYDFTLAELEGYEEFKSATPEGKQAYLQEYYSQNGQDEVVSQFQELTASEGYNALSPEEQQAFSSDYAKYYGIENQQDQGYDWKAGGKALLTMLLSSPTQFKGSVGYLMEASEENDDPNSTINFSDKWISAKVKQDVENYNKSIPDRNKKIIPLPPFVSPKRALTVGDLYDTIGSIGFTGVAMTPAALASLLGGLPGFTLGMLGSGTAAFKMDKGMITRELIKSVEDVRTKEGLGPLSQEERKQLLDDTRPERNNHALWEAGPEAIGNALGVKLLAGIFRNVAEVKVLGAVTKFLGNLGLEAGTETFTEIGQERAEHEMGMTEGEKPSFAEPKSYQEGLQKVFPTVLTLAGVTGGGAAAAGGVKRLTVGEAAKGVSDIPPDADPEETAALIEENATTPEAPPETGPLPDIPFAGLAEEELTDIQKEGLGLARSKIATMGLDDLYSLDTEQILKGEPYYGEHVVSSIDARINELEQESQQETPSEQPTVGPTSSEEVEPVQPSGDRDNIAGVEAGEAQVSEKTEAVEKETPGVEVVETPESIAAGQEVTTEPTEKQKEAGNYKKGHVKVDGLDISIENPAGSTRSGTDNDGNEWSQEMANDYGYIRGSRGYDKDHLDAFFTPNYEGGAENAYIVNQYNTDGSFDEHKIVLGAKSKEEALGLYNANYEDGWSQGKSVAEMPMNKFKKWATSTQPSRGAVKADPVKAETAPAAEDEPAKPKDKVTGKPLDRIFMDAREVTREDTGEKIEIREKASEVIKEQDSLIEKYEKILVCLGS